jgi:hypothetical protein
MKNNAKIVKNVLETALESFESPLPHGLKAKL